MSKICSNCGTSVDEIMSTGFVGCAQCYKLPDVEAAVDKMFGGKTHKTK